MAYGVFESTRIRGINVSMVSDIDIENGWMVERGDLVAGSKDIFNAMLPTGDNEVFVVGNPAWKYGSHSIIDQNEDEFINVAGKVFRTYELTPKCRFAVSDYTIDGTPAVGGYVGLQAGSGRLLASATEPATAFVGKIVAIRNMGNVYHVGQTVDQRINMVVIETVKNPINPV